MKFYSKKLKKFFAIICAFFLIVEFSLSGIPVNAAEATPKITYTVTGEATVGKQLTISLNVSNISGLYGGSWDFAYDPNVIRIDEITAGDLISSIPQTTTSNKSGHAYFWFTKTGDTTGVSTTEAKSIAKIKATVLKEGTVKLDTTNSDNSFGVNNKSSLVKLSDKNGDKITYNNEDKSISCLKPVVVLQPGKYEQNNPNIIYVGNWSTQNNSGYSGGSAMLSKTSGDYLTFKFYGTGIKINSIASPICGISKITIDGVTTTVDNYSPNNNFNNTIINKTDLPLKEHTIKIEVTNTKNSKATNYNFALDSFEILNNINEKETIQPGKYEQNNSNIIYVGNWSTQNNSGYSGGSAMLSKTSGDYLTFKFYGTGIKINSIASPICGISKITIDGVTTTVDNYSPNNNFNNTIINKTDLPLKEHTIKIEVTSTKNSNANNYNFALDSFEVLK